MNLEPYPDRTKSRLIAVFALAMAVRLMFVVAYPWMGPDAQGYNTLALNVLAGHGFSMNETPPYEPSLYRTPVYPYFVASMYALFGYDMSSAVLAAQAIIGSLTCCLVYLIAQRYWDSRIALVAGMLTALHPFLAYYVATVLTETLYAFLISCLVYLLSRCQSEGTVVSALAAGCLMGLSILCRPEAVLLSLGITGLLVLWFRFRRPGWVTAIAFLGCTVLVVSPWPVRNYLVSGKLVLLFDRGPEYDFWLCASPYWDANNQRFLDGAEAADPMVTEYANASTVEERLALKPKMWQAGLRHIQANPGNYVKMRVRGLAYLWISSGDYLLGSANRSFGQALAEKQYGLVALKAVLLLVTGLLPLFLALVGVWVNRRRLVELWPVWLVPVYITASRLLFALEPRYSMGGQPMMLMFTACGLVYLLRGRQAVFGSSLSSP